MREKNKNTEINSGSLLNEDIKYSKSLAMNYCDFRLKSLAEKIKSECFKLKRTETRLINP